MLRGTDVVGFFHIALLLRTCRLLTPLSSSSALQYRHLYRLREALPDVPFLALTATATPKVGGP